MKPYFRIGVGIVLYQTNNEVLCFQRVDKPAIWQFPQGGMDAGEEYKVALWRELYEETAITEEMIEKITEFPDWTMYEYPNQLRNETGAVVGQLHRWYFLKLKPHCAPNLEQAADKEFSAWQVMSMDDFIAIPTHDFKLPIYLKLAGYFESEIMNKPKV